MEYDPPVASSTNRTAKDHRSSNTPKGSIRIEIDQVVLEGFDDKQIDNEKLAANIMANLSLLVQNNIDSMLDLSFETNVNNKANHKIRFPLGNAFVERSIYVSTIDTGSFQISTSEGTNSSNIGQNVSTSIFRGLSSLRVDKKE